MKAENEGSKPTPDQVEEFKKELMKPPFHERPSAKRWRDVNDPGYYQIPNERRIPQSKE